MKGKITAWKNEKGFGFISPEQGGESVFFHISSVKKAAREPKVGDLVIFETSKDSQGRIKASYVLLDGVSLASPGVPKRIITEPVKKDALDYLGFLIAAGCAMAACVVFIQTAVLERALLLGAVALGVLLFVGQRVKQPPNKQFSCAKCRSIGTHDQRTIQAWNRGFIKLYCGRCHHDWLATQPKEERVIRSSYASSGSGSGCLAVLLIGSLIPVCLASGLLVWIA